MVSATSATVSGEAASRSGALVLVSCDCHVGPKTMAGYRDHIDPKLRDDFDDYVAMIEAYDAERARARGREGLVEGGAPSHDDHEGLWDVEPRNAYLRADGIAAEVMFAQGGAPFAPYPAISADHAPMDYVAPPGHRNAGARSYNRWLADLCSDDPKRHLGVGILPIRDVELAAREVEWISEAGLTGGVSLPALSGNDFPNYNDPVYEPLWAACAANDVTLNIHGGARQDYGTGPEAVTLVLTETDWFARRASWFLILSGVFERHPTLRLAITEQRTHWVGPTLADLDSLYEAPRGRDLRRLLPRKPSEYFATNCYVGASFMSRLEVEQRHDAGVDRIMWGSDYPHLEGTFPWTNESLRFSFGGVPEDELRRMLGLNAIECYHLDRAYLEDFAASYGPTVDDVRVPIDAPPEGSEMSWAFRTRGAWS